MTQTTSMPLGAAPGGRTSQGLEARRRRSAFRLRLLMRLGAPHAVLFGELSVLRRLTRMCHALHARE